MRATLRSNCLNFLPSPTRRARSMIDIFPRVAEVLGGSGPGFRFCSLTPSTPLFPVPLDLTGQIVRHQVDRLTHGLGALAGPQGDALQVERGLGDVRFADLRVALFDQLDLQLGEGRDLPGDLLRLALDPLTNVVVDGKVAPLHTDAHSSPPRIAFAAADGSPRAISEPGCGHTPGPPRVRSPQRA